MYDAERSQTSLIKPTDPSGAASWRRLPAWIGRPLCWCWRALRFVGSVPVDRVGHAGDLLLESAVDLDATRIGSGVGGVRGVGAVDHAPIQMAMGLCGRVFCGRDLVDLHPAVARPPVAA